MRDCIFCKVVEGEIPSDKVYEDEDILAFRDVRPQAPVHILIIPKKHIEKLYDLKKNNKNITDKVILVANKIAKKENIQNAFKLVVNNGTSAGQVVMHLHFHLLGGWEKKSEVKSK